MNTLSEKALSFLADYCNSVDPKTFTGCDAAEQVDLIITANEPDVEYDRDEMIEAMQEIINAASESEFGAVKFEDETIILDEQAYPTSRLLTEYAQEDTYQGDGDHYYDEWEAKGHKANGDKVIVTWHHYVERNSDTLAEDYDWSDVHSVKPINE